ncbi:UPF0182 family protein [Oerskovia sp. M15]
MGVRLPGRRRRWSGDHDLRGRGRVGRRPSVGSFGNKLLYALKFGSEQILFSDRVTEESQILYDRSPRDRVAKVAPYLTLDGKVYPAVVDGRVKWIVDGYTTTNSYPYSASRPLDEATQDTLTATSQSVAALAPQQVNYIRNSVKATVDAYDGSVDLYAWDTEDPILKAWDNVFPTSLQPISEISGDLMSHLRYPEDMFKVQRSLLTSYHVDDAREFFSGQDFWNVPRDPTAGDGQRQALSAAVLPDAPDAWPGRARVLAHDDVHPWWQLRPRDPHGIPGGGCRGGEHSGRQGGELRQAPAPRAATQRDGPGSGAGAEHVQLEPDGLQRAEHLEPRQLDGHPREPAHAPRGRRTALRAARVRPGLHGYPVPAAPQGAGQLR